MTVTTTPYVRKYPPTTVQFSPTNTPAHVNNVVQTNALTKDHTVVRVMDMCAIPTVKEITDRNPLKNLFAAMSEYPQRCK